MRTRTVSVLVISSLAACGALDEQQSKKADFSAAPSVATSAPAPAADMASTSGTVGVRADAKRLETSAASFSATPLAVDPMLMRSGRASIEVDSLETGIARVQDLARRAGATLGNTSVQSGRERLRSATLELRVPAARFDELVTGLRPIGKIDAVDVSVADVTEEFVDVNARVANARQLERRLIDLLATRTGKLADVIQVERELARVREEIERYEGRLRFLRERSAVSTLAITLHEPVPVLADRPGTNPITEAAKQAWRNFVGFLASFIAALGVLVPVAALVGGAVLVGRRWIPRAKPATDAV